MIIVIDGSAIANRIWYTNPLTKLHGQKITNKKLVEDNVGLFARMFINQLISIHDNLIDISDPYFAYFICWDVKTSKNLRKQEFPLYNANRPKTPEGTANIYPLIAALRTQLAKVHKRFDINHADYEADDLIAVMKMFTHTIEEPLMIVSRDTDFYQLLDETVSIYDPYADRIITSEGFEQDYLTVSPSDYVRAKAIVGDSSDNWKGLHNIGVKKVRLYLNKELTPEEKAIVDLGINIIKLPYHKLDLVPAIKQIEKAFMDDTEIDWADFTDFFELSPRVTKNLNIKII